MQSKPSQNYYDTLEVSRNASQEAIERMFRFLATTHHPDAGGDRQVFNQTIEAFEVLRDPKTRDSYDKKLQTETRETARLIENSKQAGPDAAIRHELLCLFYARRRQEPEAPTLGAISIEKALNLEEDVLAFHLWYFKEKAWICRGESGGYAITAEGVDQIDAAELLLASRPRIAATSDSSCKSLAEV